MRILMVDFMGSVYYHFHAKEPHVEYNFIRHVQSITDTYKIDKVLVLGEGGGSNYRTTLHPGYKATRKANREKRTPAEKVDFQKFLDKTNKLTDTLLPMIGCSCLSSWGVEADDIAAYLCSSLPAEEYQILLLSSDSDWQTLLTRPNTVIGSYKEFAKGEPKTKDRWRRFANCVDEFGFTPDKSFVKKMMIGDTSDDIPGLDGIGKTIAAKIVELHPTLAEIVANKDSIQIPRMSTKAYDSLRNCEESFKLSYQLMNLLWSEEKWVEIFGKTELEKLQANVEKVLAEPPVINKEAFLDVCYENGWLAISDDIDDFLRPFLSNRR